MQLDSVGDGAGLGSRERVQGGVVLPHVLQQLATGHPRHALWPVPPHLLVQDSVPLSSNDMDGDAEQTYIWGTNLSGACRHAATQCGRLIAAA